MRALRTDSLSLFLYHQLKSRIGAGEAGTRERDWDDDQVLKMIVAILNEVPGLEARTSGESARATIEVHLKDGGETQTVSVREILDSLHLVCREFGELIGDR